MKVYAASIEADLLLFHWWVRLAACGDLLPTYGAGASQLVTFLRFAAEGMLAYAEDERGICASFHVKPFMQGASVTLWVAPEHRASRQLYAEINAAYEAALAEYPVLLGITREALLRSHRRWGYTVVGRVPGLRVDGDGWIVSLTQESFLAARERRLRHGRPERQDRAVASG